MHEQGDGRVQSRELHIAGHVPGPEFHGHGIALPALLGKLALLGGHEGKQPAHAAAQEGRGRDRQHRRDEGFARHQRAAGVANDLGDLDGIEIIAGLVAEQQRDVAPGERDGQVSRLTREIAHRPAGRKEARAARLGRGRAALGRDTGNPVAFLGHSEKDIEHGLGRSKVRANRTRGGSLRIAGREVQVEAVGQNADETAHPQLPGGQCAPIHFERQNSPGLRRQRGQPSVEQPLVVQVRLLQMLRRNQHSF